MFRHSYCAARLQTADRVLVHGRDPTEPHAYQWIPVSTFTVAKEMGHGGDSLVKRIYGHLGEVPQRSEVVEYRTAHHSEILGERLAAMRVRVAKIGESCRGTNAKGEVCGMRGRLSSEGLCFWHDPARKEQSQRARPHAAVRGRIDAEPAGTRAV